MIHPTQEMLPSFLTGTYQQYKKDTDDIATWLATTAKSFGYASDLLPDDKQSVHKKPKAKSKSKPKTKKQLRDAARRIPRQQREYIIPIKEFLSLAAYIAGHVKAPFKIPHSALSTLKRAIEARRKSNVWFRTNEKDDDSDEGHAHFIGILEEVHDILKPHSSPSTEGAASGDLDVDNLFANLQLEEPSETFLNAPGPDRNATHPVPRIRYEAEPMKERSEMLFAAFSLFNDIWKIHVFLQNMWEQYHKGDLDLITVSITSNTAIDVVRRLEQEFFDRFPSAKDPEQVINMLFHFKCLMQRIQPDPKPEHAGNIPFNIDMYETAQFLLMDTLTLLSAFADVVTPNHVPIHKPGFFGIYNPKADRKRMSDAQKFQEDKIIWTAVFTDFCFLAKSTKNIPAEDELTRGIRIMVNDKKLNIWTLFAARLFIDVHHLLRSELDIPFKQLQDLGTKIKDSWAMTVRFRGDLELETWPPQNDMVIEENLIKVIESWLFEDPIQASMKRVVRNVPLPEGQFRLFRQHPLLCGLFAFSLRMRAQEYGVAYVNAWGGVLYTSHLYNAVRQDGYCQAPWMDMEMLIGMQTAEKVFVGGRPTNTDAYMKHFALSMGYSATQYARNRRGQGAVASRMGPRGLGAVGELSNILRDRYCENADLHDWSLDTIEKVLNANYEVDIDADDDGEEPEPGVTFVNLKSRDKKMAKEHLRKKFRQSAQLSPVEMLYALTISMSQEVPLLSFDYFGLHRSCWSVLRITQRAMHQKLLKYFGPGYLETENQLPFIVGYIFMVASQSQKASEQLPGLKKMLKGATVGSELLASAGEGLQMLLTSESWSTQMDMQVQMVAWYGRMLFPVKDADGKLRQVGTKIDLGEYELVLEQNGLSDAA